MVDRHQTSNDWIQIICGTRLPSRDIKLTMILMMEEPIIFDVENIQVVKKVLKEIYEII